MTSQQEKVRSESKFFRMLKMGEEANMLMHTTTQVLPDVPDTTQPCFVKATWVLRNAIFCPVMDLRWRTEIIQMLWTDDLALYLDPDIYCRFCGQHTTIQPCRLCQKQESFLVLLLRQTG